MKRLQDALVRHQQLFSQLHTLAGPLQQWVAAVITSLEQGGKVVWLGNGGSAADAQHMAAELVVRYVKNRRPLAAIALTTDTSILTAHPNDFDFDSVFERQVRALVQPVDVVVGMSTSGNSVNVVRALAAAGEIGATTVALTGQTPNRLAALAHIPLAVPAVETARVQEAHTFLSHVLCEALDAHFSH
ncbi:MAG TPA: SIS domain-containing protein [Sulfurivirga caldicuralii]|nr:SIS domain-containing protein [Sulfurivirga caldicuralii]